jgi:hypothetical protein
MELRESQRICVSGEAGTVIGERRGQTHPPRLGRHAPRHHLLFFRDASANVHRPGDRRLLVRHEAQGFIAKFG